MRRSWHNWSMTQTIILSFLFEQRNGFSMKPHDSPMLICMNYLETLFSKITSCFLFLMLPVRILFFFPFFLFEKHWVDQDEWSPYSIILRFLLFCVPSDPDQWSWFLRVRMQQIYAGHLTTSKAHLFSFSFFFFFLIDSIFSYTSVLFAETLKVFWHTSNQEIKPFLKSDNLTVYCAEGTTSFYFFQLLLYIPISQPLLHVHYLLIKRLYTV